MVVLKILFKVKKIQNYLLSKKNLAYGPPIVGGLSPQVFERGICNTALSIHTDCLFYLNK